MTIIRYIILAFSLLGFSDSSYITFFESNATLSCNTNLSFISCENVLNSPYSHLFGIPWSLLGMIWFIAFLLLSLTGYDDVLIHVIFMFLGIGSLIYLIFVEIGVIGYICLYCTIAHVSAILIIVSLVYSISKYKKILY